MVCNFRTIGGTLLVVIGSNLWRSSTTLCCLHATNCLDHVVSVPPHAVRTYIVSRDIVRNMFYPTWRVFTDDRTDHLGISVLHSTSRDASSCKGVMEHLQRWNTVETSS